MRRILLPGLLVLAALSLPPAAAEPPHTSAGIGDDDPLLSVTGDYNLKLVFATQGSGEYLADVRVRIADPADRPLLETVSSGPLLYVRLPAGSYRVVAQFEGKAQGKTVTLGARQPQSVYFYWPAGDAAASR